MYYYMTLYDYTKPKPYKQLHTGKVGYIWLGRNPNEGYKPAGRDALSQEQMIRSFFKYVSQGYVFEIKEQEK